MAGSKGGDTSNYRARSASVIVVVACAVLCSLAAGQAAAAESPGPTPPLGHILFFDDFSNHFSGWPTNSLPSGGGFAYGDAAYLITPAPRRSDFAGAPYAERHLDLIQRVDVRFPNGPTLGAEGGGVVCVRPDIHGAAYHFIVWPDGGWSINRQAESDAQVVNVVNGELVGKGSASGASVTVVAVCRTSTTGSNSITHLSLFIQGVRVADLDDPWSAAASTGWRGGLLAVGGTLPKRSPVTFTHYSLASDRVLADPSPSGSPATGPPPVAGVSATIRWAAFALGAALVAGSVGLFFLVRRRRGGRADLPYPPMPPPPS